MHNHILDFAYLRLLKTIWPLSKVLVGRVTDGRMRCRSGAADDAQ